MAGPHDGSGGRGGRFGPSDRQAVQDAGGVHEPLDGVVGGCLEGLGDLLVHHQVHCVGLAEPVHRGQCFDRAGQVVDHLEGSALVQTWFPHAERLTVPDAGHLLMLQNPTALAQGLTDYLARHPLNIRGPVRA